MQASDHVLIGYRVIFLGEDRLQPLRCKSLFVENFYKFPPNVFKRFGLQFKTPIDFAGLEFKHLEIDTKERFNPFSHKTQHRFIQAGIDTDPERVIHDVVRIG